MQLPKRTILIMRAISALTGMVLLLYGFIAAIETWQRNLFGHSETALYDGRPVTTYHPGDLVPLASCLFITLAGFAIAYESLKDIVQLRKK